MIRRIKQSAKRQGRHYSRAELIEQAKQSAKWYGWTLYFHFGTIADAEP